MARSDPPECHRAARPDGRAHLATSRTRTPLARHRRWTRYDRSTTLLHGPSCPSRAAPPSAHRPSGYAACASAQPPVRGHGGQCATLTTRHLPTPATHWLLQRRYRRSPDRPPPEPAVPPPLPVQTATLRARGPQGPARQFGYRVGRATLPVAPAKSSGPQGPRLVGPTAQPPRQ